MSCIEPTSSDAGVLGRTGRSFYYGWVMLPIATLAMIATSPAQTFAISTFHESLRTSLGITATQLTGAYMLGTFLASLPMTWVGVLMDRHGLRRTMTGVVMLFGCVCIATSQVQGLLTLFVAFLLLRMLGQGALSLLSGNTLPFWFRRRLGTVEGIRHLGMAGAIAMVPAVNLWLIYTFGWRWTWVILGITVLVVMLPVMLLVRNRPEDVGQHIDGLSADANVAHGRENPAVVSFTFSQARRTRSFWIVCTITAMFSMLSTAVQFNMIPLFIARGLAASDAAFVFVVFAGSLAFTQFFGGILADRFPLNRLLAMGTAGLVATMAVAWWIESVAWVVPLGLLLGVSHGLVTAAAGPLWPRYYGTDHIGSIRGSLVTVMVAASSVGPFVMGVCVDLTGSYDPALWLFMVMPMPMVMLAWLATPPRPPASGSSTVAVDPA